MIVVVIRKGSVAGFAVAALVATPAAAAGPLSFDAQWTLDPLRVVSGGVRTGNDVISDIDLGTGWQGKDGWSLRGDILADTGGGLSVFHTGDIQGVSNNDGPPGVRLFQAYASKTSGPVTTSVGLIDFSSHFDVQAPGGDFINLSRHIGPDIAQAGVSISPVSALGMVSEWQVSRSWQVRGAVYDGVPGDPDHPDVFVSLHLSRADGAFAIAEAERDFDGGYVKLGHWLETAARDRVDGAGMAKPSGSYAQLSLTLTHERDHPDQGLAALLRLGQADARVLPVSRSAELTLVYSGPLPGRDSDGAGVSVSDACFGQAWRVQNDAAACERNYELYYKAVVTSTLSLQPEVQVIVHPSGRRDLDPAVVMGFRLIKTFGG